MKYFLDEDLSPEIAVILRRRGIDAVSVHEVDCREESDLEQLQRAAREGRCLVTRNRNDFLLLNLQFLRDGLAHSGILIVPGDVPRGRFAGVARALMEYAERYPEGVPSYTVDFLKRAR